MELTFINGNPKRPYICAELQDQLLDLLIDQCALHRHSSLNKKPVQDHFNGIDTDIISGLFHLAQDDGLITQYVENHATFTLVMQPQALKFKKLGGYAAKEELLNQQITLLNQQIKALQDKNIIAKTDGIVNTVANLSSSLFKLFNQLG